MSSKEFGLEWILRNNSPQMESPPLRKGDELIAVAQKLWPQVRAIALRESRNWNFNVRLALASEIWEKVLLSVSKTLERCGEKESGIANLEAYLTGAFYHRVRDFRAGIDFTLPSDGDGGMDRATAVTARMLDRPMHCKL